jgi:uncharacterized protein YciI
MPRLPLLLAFVLLAGLVRGQTPPPPPAAPALPPDMTVYYFCLLTRGPEAAAIPSERAAELQRGHMDNIRRLADAGKLLVAGPFMDRGDWRGVFILKCASLDEAKALVATDPAVQAGRLVADVRPWLTMKGNIRDPEFPAPPAGLTPGKS